MTRKVERYLLWTAIFLVALVLVPAGGAKLAGVPKMHESFAILGLPGWFGYFIGACEIAGAIGLFVRRLRVAAASGICVVMLGALYFHINHTPLAQGIPAFVVLLLCIFIIVQGRKPAAA